MPLGFRCVDPLVKYEEGVRYQVSEDISPMRIHFYATKHLCLASFLFRSDTFRER